MEIAIRYSLRITSPATIFVLSSCIVSHYSLVFVLSKLIVLSLKTIIGDPDEITYDKTLCDETIHEFRST